MNRVVCGGKAAVLPVSVPWQIDAEVEIFADLGTGFVVLVGIVCAAFILFALAIEIEERQFEVCGAVFFDAEDRVYRHIKEQYQRMNE